MGNTPSTVLFFLAMSVGVGIAFLFIFFTIRYFVRSRYGLHVYPVSNRGMMFSATFRDNAVITYSPSNRELQEHLDYLRTHHFLRDEFLERRILSSQARRRRRRRRGRYAKMKKLTAEEVEKLFPKKLYAEWLHEGDSASVDALLIQVDVVDHDESVPAVLVPVKLSSNTIQEDSNEFAVVEMHEMHDLRARTLSDATEDAMSLAVLLGGKGELHFDSGSCAICLESFEDDDIVRGLVCGHVFHAECVDPWLTRRRACCPICKRDYYKEESSADGSGVREGSDNEEGDRDVPTTNENSATNADGELNPDSNADGNSTGNGNPEGENTTRHASDAPVSTTNATTTDGNTNDTPAEGNANSVTRTNTYRQNDEDSINYDALRNDPNLQALLVELIPLGERVRVILDEHPELNLETRGREVADEKFKSFWKRVFWRLMGILKDDVFNWAVIQIYQTEYTNEDSETPQANESTRAESPVESPGETQQTAQVASTAGDTESTRAGYQVASNMHSRENIVPSPQVTQSDIDSSSNSHSPSIYHNASQMSEVDVSDAARRDIVARQV